MTKTMQKGANLERQAWLAKVRRMRKSVTGVYAALLDQLMVWGKGRVKRVNKKSGGLGK